MNWSPVVKFRKIPVLTVDETSVKRERTHRIMTLVILDIMPLATMAAPKHIAQIISQMVFNMPFMPPVDTKSLSAADPVSTAVEP